MKVVQISNPVFACQPSGISGVVLAAGFHPLTPETEREVLLGNGAVVDAPAEVEAAILDAEAKAAEAAAEAAADAAAPAPATKTKRGGK